MSEHAEEIVRAVSTATYSISGSLVLGDFLEVLNQNAAAIGVIIAFMTFVVNFIFQCLNHRIIRQNNGERRRR